ncbi:hypothetical protein SNOG_05211 [Parastagonospora nodorum SN15]|uniref:Uncharacterized protein n=1 Tax=Phaeosphaeria nodorum (strain SN15 / ATCC MYA-4574 / FGSC 10173) TaxID=321614 RepID=Q0USQ3_PHANO|nr:hypothetical protein SNOG_05211 [Parastagonospora nodorum SN15]EAT87602.1 hypothetical protein SNOG_05211 [Parastagonospora nodorum SN15]
MEVKMTQWKWASDSIFNDDGLKFRKHMCKLFGYLGMILSRYRCRQPIIEFTATQVLHQNIRVSEWPLYGHLKFENTRYGDTCTLADDVHGGYLAQQRGLGVVIDGAIRNPSNPIDVVRKCEFKN